MKYLVDANVLCEPTKQFGVPKVIDWLTAQDAELVVNPVIVGEIWRGVDALPEGRKKQDLVVWFGDLQSRVPCLDWTRQTALDGRRW